MWSLSWLAGVALLAAASCKASADDDMHDDGVSSDTGAAVVRTCVPPDGVSGRPESVEDVVALLAALPVPTTLPCFLESLERPLQMMATTNAFSAQPSDGDGNPRMFIVSGPLTMAVVPTGIGRELLELAVDVGDGESIKAELDFPLMERVEPADPYDRINQGAGTTCDGCHGDERVSDAIDFTTAFVSEALQPPPENFVSVSFTRQHAVACDPELEPERCAMLTALFAHGDVFEHEFPVTSRICRMP